MIRDEIVRKVLAFLDDISVHYELLEHEPTASMTECAAIEEKMHAVVVRNLFLTTRRQQGFYLCLMRGETPFRSGEVSRQAGTSRLCFADEEAMAKYLNVKPGSVSPLGLMFDGDNAVSLLMDQSLLNEKELIFHPCLNTCSVKMSTEDFLRVFLPAVHHEALFIEVSV